MYEYNILEDEWKERKASMTEKIKGHACSIVSEQELIIIGGEQRRNRALSSSSIFHLKKQTWKPGPSLPTSIAWAPFVKSKPGSHYLGYLIGGRGNDERRKGDNFSSAIYALKKDLSKMKGLEEEAY